MTVMNAPAELFDVDAQEFAQVIDNLESRSAAGDGEATRLVATVEAVGAARPQSWRRALDSLQLAAEQGSANAQEQLKLLAGNCSSRDWHILRSAIDIETLFAPPTPTSLSDDPRIRSASSFASPAECAWIVDAARSRIRRAQVWDPSRGGGTEDDGRSNSAMEFRLLDLDVVIEIVRARIAAITKLPVPLFETPQVLHYSVGQTFEPHHDYIDPVDPGNREHLATWGQRIATFLLYLNEPAGGGETEFPLLGLRHHVRTGDALFFANIDRSGSVDLKTLHAGRAPTKGEKWVLSQWIRERSRRPKEVGASAQSDR